jgi:hypothetical protein
MNLADVFTTVLVILGLLTVFVGWWLAMTGLFPRMVDGCAARLGGSPWKCLIVGVVCAVPLIAGGAMVGQVSSNTVGKLLGVAIIVGTVLLALAGTAGLALRIGGGLPAANDGGEPWRRVRRGGIVLAITYGTIVLLPLTLLAGLGALALVAINRGEPKPAAAPVPAPIS